MNSIPSSGGRCSRYIRPLLDLRRRRDDLDGDRDVAVRGAEEDLAERAVAASPGGLGGSGFVGGMAEPSSRFAPLLEHAASASSERRSRSYGHGGARRETSTRSRVHDAGMSFAVLTRELDACSAYAAAFARLGLEAIAMPVTRTEPPRDHDALARALDRGGHAAIVDREPARRDRARPGDRGGVPEAARGLGGGAGDAPRARRRGDRGEPPEQRPRRRQPRAGDGLAPAISPAGGC